MTSRPLRIALFAFAFCVIRTAAASAQLELYASDDVNFKFTIQLQLFYF